jgi:putative two-component system response regulator
MNATNAQHILVVDDNELITRYLEQLLTNDGHRVATVCNGREAIEYVTKHRPDLILSDLDMPEMSGYELCRQVKTNPATQLIPVLIITGEHALEAKLKSWDLGADDFLTKPFDLIQVLARCRSLLKMKRLLGELDSAEAVVFAFARAVEAKCGYTWGHSERVVAYAMALGNRLGLSEIEQVALRKGAILHDIGKIHTPDAILNKPGALTPAEFDVIKEHPIQGARIVEPLRTIRDAIPIIRWHHERYDGHGYPDGLRGTETPILARILAVADVYDALSSERPYRLALPHSVCLQMLRDNADHGGLDPDLVRCFCDEIALPLDHCECREPEAESGRMTGLMCRH